MYRIVIAQLIITLGVAIIYVFVDVVGAYSIALGGLVCSVPSGFMAWRLDRQIASPGLALKYLVTGEMGKLMITAMMFVAVFVWVRPLDITIFFAALVLAMSLTVIVPLVDRRPRGQKA